MTLTSKYLAAAAIAVSAPWIVAPSSAAPLSGPLSLDRAAPGAVETVQYWRYGYGPRARFYGYDNGYYSYGYVPRHRYRYVVPPYRGYGDRGFRQCTGDKGMDSAFPSWMCQMR
jgi:hypothetical protein